MLASFADIHRARLQHGRDAMELLDSEARSYRSKDLVPAPLSADQIVEIFARGDGAANRFDGVPLKLISFDPSEDAHCRSDLSAEIDGLLDDRHLLPLVGHGLDECFYSSGPSSPPATRFPPGTIGRLRTYAARHRFGFKLFRHGDATDLSPQDEVEIAGRMDRLIEFGIIARQELRRTCPSQRSRRANTNRKAIA